MIPPNIIEQAITWRRVLHQSPEVSGEEYQTAEKINAFLQSLHPSMHLKGLGGTSILAQFTNKLPGPTLLFRAELDALPIQEINTFNHRSKVDGVSHKCGHDGHMSILLGLALLLSQNNTFKGTVSLLFQSAEETGAGALAVLADQRFSALHFDQVFALHNLPGQPFGKILCKEGSITASVKSLIICLQGKTAHAAEPEKGINPAQAIAQILVHLPSLEIPDPSSNNFALITPVHLTMGEKAYGVSAGEGEVHLTLRAWTEERMTQLTQQLLEKIESICNTQGLTFSYSWTDSFQANNNDTTAVKIIQDAAKKLSFDYQEMSSPLKWGEDFGAITQRYNGTFFGLGAGKEVPALHNPDYDFPDELIEKGLAMFYEILKSQTI
jgi:amidohydrolase